MAGMDMLHTQLTDVMWVWAVGVGGMFWDVVVVGCRCACVMGGGGGGGDDMLHDVHIVVLG